MERASQVDVDERTAAAAAAVDARRSKFRDGIFFVGSFGFRFLSVLAAQSQIQIFDAPELNPLEGPAGCTCNRVLSLESYVAARVSPPVEIAA
jgi:hypothetical protein